MKNNHKKEILLARIVFAAVLVIIAAVIALLIALISSRMRDDTAKNEVTQATETQKETETEIVAEPTEKVTESEVVEVTNPPRWTTDKVNFRKKPSTSAKIISTLDKETQVEWLAESEGWANISYNGKTGYIKAEYLTDQAPAGAAAADGESGNAAGTQ